MADRTRTETVLRVNPIACDGVGICAHLAPDLVRIDQWGFPVVTSELNDARVRKQARAAARACPHRALFLDHTP